MLFVNAYISEILEKPSTLTTGIKWSLWLVNRYVAIGSFWAICKYNIFRIMNTFIYMLVNSLEWWAPVNKIEAATVVEEFIKLTVMHYIGFPLRVSERFLTETISGKEV